MGGRRLKQGYPFAKRTRNVFTPILTLEELPVILFEYICCPMSSFTLLLLPVKHNDQFTPTNPKM